MQGVLADVSIAMRHVTIALMVGGRLVFWYLSFNTITNSDIVFVGRTGGCVNSDGLCHHCADGGRAPGVPVLGLGCGRLHHPNSAHAVWGGILCILAQRLGHHCVLGRLRWCYHTGASYPWCYYTHVPIPLMCCLQISCNYPLHNKI